MFKNYGGSVSKDTTAECTMYGLSSGDTAPTLIVRPSWQVNQGYTNARLKTSRPHMRIIQKKGMTSHMLNTIRDEDRELFPKHVIVGWRDVFDESGKAVEFTPEMGVEFLKAIPDTEFDDLRDFCSTPANFNTSDIDAEEVSGN